MQTGWYSRGIEIVPARVEYCIDFVYEYETKNKVKIDKEDKRLAKIDKSRYSLTPLKAKRERKNANVITWNPLSVDMEEDYDFSKKEPDSDSKDSKDNIT
jgi:hypothetical protein